MRHSTPSFQVWTVRLAAFALLAHVGLSAPLWDLAPVEGAFPQLPLLNMLPVLGPTGLFVQGCVLALLCLVAGIFSGRNWAAAALAVWLGWLVLQDVNRLQPWLYFYLLVLVIVLVKSEAAEKQTALRWLLAAVYCWSGLNKLTPWFAEDNFAWLCSAFTWLEPLGKIKALGYGAALLELALGLALLWPGSRPVARWLVLAFHLGLVATLVALDWNYVVIPWNLAMAGMVWVNFRDAKPVFLPKNKLYLATLFLAAVLPLAHWLRAWPEPLSWSMYANTQPEATFFTVTGDSCLSKNPLFKNALLHQENDKFLFDAWCLASRQVPVFAHGGSFRQAGKLLCNCSNAPDSAGLYILRVNRWRNNSEHIDTLPCRTLR